MEYEITRMLHILLMALWLGSIVKGVIHCKSVIGIQWINEDIHKKFNRIAEIYGIVSGVGTILTGGYLLHLVGGFDGTDWPIHLGMTLALAMAAIGAFRIGPLYHDLVDDLEMNVERENLEPTIKRLRFWYLVSLWLWADCFLLMIFRHGF